MLLPQFLCAVAIQTRQPFHRHSSKNMRVEVVMGGPDSSRTDDPWRKGVEWRLQTGRRIVDKPTRSTDNHESHGQTVFFFACSMSRSWAKAFPFFSHFSLSCRSSWKVQHQANSGCKRHGGLAVWSIASEGEDRGLKSRPASEFSKFPSNKFPTTQYFKHQSSS